MVAGTLPKTVRLVLGTAQLRGTYGVVGRPEARRSDQEARSLLERAVKLGFSAIDTAAAYDDAEALVGRSGLAVPVHTKIDPALEPADSLARSLDRLRRRRVEVLYFHDPEIATHDPSGSITRASALVGELVGALGASVYGEHELRAAVTDGRFGAIQFPFNLIDRRIDERTFEEATAAGVQLFVRSAFLQGLLLTPPERVPPHLMPLTPYVEAVRDLARSADVSVPVLALGWVRQQPGISGVIVGAQTEQELEGLADAWGVPELSDDVLRACRELPTPPAEWCDPRGWPHPTG